MSTVDVARLEISICAEGVRDTRREGLRGLMIVQLLATEMALVVGKIFEVVAVVTGRAGLIGCFDGRASDLFVVRRCDTFRLFGHGVIQRAGHQQGHNHWDVEEHHLVGVSGFKSLTCSHHVQWAFYTEKQDSVFNGGLSGDGGSRCLGCSLAHRPPPNYQNRKNPPLNWLSERQRRSNQFQI